MKNSTNSISNIENMANNIAPTITKLLIAIGITVCLLSIMVAIYAYIKKKCDTRMILGYFIRTFTSGAMVSIGGVLVNIMANFDIEFTTYKVEIPLYFIVSLIIFYLIMKYKNSKS